MSTPQLLLIDDDARLAQDGRRIPDAIGARPSPTPVRCQPAWSCSPTTSPDLRAPRPDAARRRRPRPVPRGARCAAAAPSCRCSCSPRAASRWTASSASSSAPTTTCPSRSSRASCWPASRRCCAGAAPRRRRPRRPCCASAASRSTSARASPLDGKAGDLTGHQFDLLVALAERAGRVLSRDQIMDAARPSARGLRPLDRRPHLAHPRRYRGRSEGAAPPHRARRRLRVRQAGGRRPA